MVCLRRPYPLKCFVPNIVAKFLLATLLREYAQPQKTQALKVWYLLIIQEQPAGGLLGNLVPKITEKALAENVETASGNCYIFSQGSL